MIENPYHTNNVLKHQIVELWGWGWMTACGIFVTQRLRFNGFEPRLCDECFPPQEAQP